MAIVSFNLAPLPAADLDELERLVIEGWMQRLQDDAPRLAVALRRAVARENLVRLAGSKHSVTQVDVPLEEVASATLWQALRYAAGLRDACAPDWPDVAHLWAHLLVAVDDELRARGEKGPGRGPVAVHDDSGGNGHARPH